MKVIQPKRFWWDFKSFECVFSDANESYFNNIPEVWIQISESWACMEYIN